MKKSIKFTLNDKPVKLKIEPDRSLLWILRGELELTGTKYGCGEGVCGSDSMNINGVNGLACITPLSDLKEPVEIRPLPGLPVVRDLIVDMETKTKLN